MCIVISSLNGISDVFVQTYCHANFEFLTFKFRTIIVDNIQQKGLIMCTLLRVATSNCSISHLKNASTSIVNDQSRFTTSFCFALNTHRAHWNFPLHDSHWKRANIHKSCLVRSPCINALLSISFPFIYTNI